MEFRDTLVLVTGASAIGKSELALELISRGNGLIADDIVELYRISPDTLEGRCPAVLRDFLEVRGIGILNIRTIFGETAVRPRKLLKFMVHLEDHSNETFSELDRLQVNATFQEILGLPSVLFGVGLPDENAHAPNEKLDLGNFHGGIIASAFLYDEIAKS